MNSRSIDQNSTRNPNLLSSSSDCLSPLYSPHPQPDALPEREPPVPRDEAVGPDVPAELVTLVSPGRGCPRRRRTVGTSSGAIAFTSAGHKNEGLLALGRGGRGGGRRGLRASPRIPGSCLFLPLVVAFRVAAPRVRGRGQGGSDEVRVAGEGLGKKAGADGGSRGVDPSSGKQ